jgi:uncharacterized protein (TIGR03435 family)
MRRFTFTALGLSVSVLMLNWSGRSQTAPSQHDLSFEVASVRATAPGPSFTRFEGGLENGRIRYTSISLRNLLVSAYDVSYDSVVGPAWTNDVRLDIEATFPPRISKQQFRLMLLHLLEERFGLVAHLESKLVDGYALVVAQSGPRLEPAAAEDANVDQREPSPPPPGTRDDDGFPITSTGPGVHKVCILSSCRFRATSASMEDLAGQLPCRCSIVDETHFPGKYKFVLTGDVHRLTDPLPPEPADIGRPDLKSSLEAAGIKVPALREQSSTDIFHALEKQLGLKLERKKVSTPVVSVDHIERAPTDN